MQVLKKWLACVLAGSIVLCGAAAVSAESATRLGDVNNDGYINNKDLSRMKQYLADDLTQIVFDATDMNKDGRINNKDYARLKKYLADPDMLRNGWVEENGKTYYYAMNGQTGKVCGVLPVDWGKLLLVSGLLTVLLFLLLFLGGCFL